LVVAAAYIWFWVEVGNGSLLDHEGEGVVSHALV
jgi:hypothetical protein